VIKAISCISRSLSNLHTEQDEADQEIIAKLLGPPRFVG